MIRATFFKKLSSFYVRTRWQWFIKILLWLFLVNILKFSTWNITERYFVSEFGKCDPLWHYWSWPCNCRVPLRKCHCIFFLCFWKDTCSSGKILTFGNKLQLLILEKKLKGTLLLYNNLKGGYKQVAMGLFSQVTQLDKRKEHQVVPE